jgi:benzoate 4-monooxygenase
MAVLSYWSLAAICTSLVFVHYYIVPYFTTYKGLRNIPGPRLARFSNVWLAFGARRGKKFAWVHWAHEQYGPIVRVGYNHVSIAEPEGLHAVYAHGNGFLKESVHALAI